MSRENRANEVWPSPGIWSSRPLPWQNHTYIRLYIRLQVTSLLVCLFRRTAVAMLRGGRWWHVQRGIGCEETMRTQHEPILRAWHYRPFLNTRRVMHANKIPDDNTCIIDRAIRRRPAWQTITARILIRIRTRRIALLRCVGCHPQVVAGETSSFQIAGVWMGKRQNVFAR